MVQVVLAVLGTSLTACMGTMVAKGLKEEVRRGRSARSMVRKHITR